MNIRVFLRTLNPCLSFILLLCVTTVLLMDLWLLDVEAPCKLFVALGKFNYGVALSYIAAYIFYLITVHYPETKSAVSIYTAASFPAKAIVTNVENIFIDMGKKMGLNLKSEDLSDETIKEVLSKTKCFGDSTMSKHDLSYESWIEYLLQKESVIKSFQQQLHPLYTKMDSEYIAALADVEQSDIIESSIAMIYTGILFNKFTKGDICFDSGLEIMFIEWHQKAKVLHSIINERNTRYEIKG